MAKFTQAVRAVLIAAMIAGLPACGEKGKTPASAPMPAPIPTTIGGTATGLSGGGLVLQLNGGEDLVVNANGKFKFPKPLSRGTAYAVTVKSSPVKQVCAVSQGNGSMPGTAINTVEVSCTNKSYAIGGTVSGLSGKGLVLQLKDAKEIAIDKNGNFIFPDIRMTDGNDFSVAIKAAPVRQKCVIDTINTAPDSDTINIVAVTCSKKRQHK